MIRFLIAKLKQFESSKKSTKCIVYKYRQNKVVRKNKKSKYL